MIIGWINGTGREESYKSQESRTVEVKIPVPLSNAVVSSNDGKLADVAQDYIVYNYLGEPVSHTSSGGNNSYISVNLTDKPAYIVKVETSQLMVGQYSL